MLNHLIRWSLRNRAIILCVSLLVLGLGFKTGSELSVEVLPDLTKPTVTILTEAPGLAPEEVEALVTQALTGSSPVLKLTDDKGKVYLVATGNIAFVEVGSDQNRRIGFVG